MKASFIKRSTLFLLVFLFVQLSIAVNAATPFTTLQPGQFREINQNLQINVVFVGYHQGTGPRDINEAVFRAGLPHRYRTLDVDPSSYVPGINDPGFDERNAVWVGNSFNYNYNIVYANQAFEDAYFGFIASVAASDPCSVTYLQEYYNTQHSRSLNITDNLCIEANVAEYWLAHHAPSMLGIDTSKNTVFLINWYGRPDFKFHTYLPFSYIDPDPDTGFPFGWTQNAESIAWGGTTPDDEQNGFGDLKRVWLYDLSAGPESSSANYLLDAAELGGLPFYSMPPVWEYGNMSAYRPFNDLSGDLAKITRYVAIDGLFTKSPILPPALSPPKMPNSIQFDLNLYQADQSWSLHDYIKPDRVVSEHAKLRPYNTQSARIKDLPFGTRQEQIYQCGRDQMISMIIYETPPTTSCYGARDNTFADPYATDFFLYHRDHLNQFIDGGADLEVPMFIYGVPDNWELPFQGLADDNHSDGRASFLYGDLIDSSRWHGITHTATHEIGHYMGMSHTHDGWDYEDFTYWSPNCSDDECAQHYYLWAGDDSDTVMSYLNLSNNFSQFDRDNMDRWMTAIYINQANSILPRLLASPRAGEISGSLISADADASSALPLYQSMNYSAAVLKAKSAYDKVLAAAGQINVLIEPNGAPSELRSHRPNPGLIDPPPGRTHRFSPVSEDRTSFFR